MQRLRGRSRPNVRWGPKPKAEARSAVHGLHVPEGQTCAGGLSQRPRLGLQCTGCTFQRLPPDAKAAGQESAKRALGA